MRNLAVIFSFFVIILVGCSKAPKYVIAEDDMVDLLSDLYKAEAIMEDDNNRFNNDSLKMVMRQSVFLKHNVSQEQFDTSLIWYAHNLDVYGKVYVDVIERLEEEKRELTKGDFTNVSSAGTAGDVQPSIPRYRMVGDTADIWGNVRTWLLLPGFNRNRITFDLKPDKENMRGDVYELAFKMCNTRKLVKVYMGVDYKDGSTTYQQKNYNTEGWHKCKIQSDSVRDVIRIYGYIVYTPTPYMISYLDSVELLRTHLERSTYTTLLRQQKFIMDKALVKEEKKITETLKDEQKVLDKN
ncbi:MAG: DUF4296 domain-containing protein [Bacteroidales bacterium]|nr:DUF4296 domain-containing protein [Bacteroidales bacterium]